MPRRSNYNNRRRYNSSNREQDYTFKYKGAPEESASISDAISVKALKDLPHSSYSILADPYTAMLPSAKPYPILNRFNRVLSPNYKGVKNLDGGNVSQYANSVTSGFLKYFDVLRLSIKANYRYLPMDRNQVRGSSLADEMIKAISEAVSTLNATTFTQLAINNFGIKTDLNLGSRTNVSADHIYTDTSDVLYAMSVYYQLFFQNILSVLNWHNSFKLKQGTMLRNAWNREVPALNSFFGLMNKKTLTSVINSINLSFEGEYIDTDFMKQMNTLVTTPSRRSDSMTDPVLELQVGWNHPSVFEIYTLDSNGQPSTTPFFSDANMKVSIDGEDMSIWTICEELRDYLSMEATTYWARKTYAGTTAESDLDRFNYITKCFNGINKILTIFKPAWSDFRECFDVMVRTGTISWTKGFRPSIIRENDAQILDYQIINDIYCMVLSGPNKLYFNDDTKRWRSFSLWNMYKGVPLYDSISGGSFLAIGFKQFEPGNYGAETIKYLPALFNQDVDFACAAVSRDGREIVITAETHRLYNNLVLGRLVPLQSQESLEMRIATFDKSAGRNASVPSEYYPYIYKLLTQLTGVCLIKDEGNSIEDFSLDPDILAVYQFEIEDITNEAITYARANAPFRGTTSGADLIGFVV